MEGRIIEVLLYRISCACATEAQQVTVSSDFTELVTPD